MLPIKRSILSIGARLLFSLLLAVSSAVVLGLIEKLLEARENSKNFSY